MDSRDITAEMNILMSLECAEQEARAPAANSSQLNFLNGPHKEEDRGIWAEELYGDKEFYDDIIGKGYSHALTVKAHELETKVISDRGIYTKIQSSEAAEQGCKVISTKWLDVNKSVDANPNIRSRMFGRELKLDNRLDLFAATPLFKALKMICSICASHQ